MSVEIRPASLQDGVAVLSLLEDVGYYPEPVSFAQTFRRTITNPGFLVRVAESEDGRVVGVATLALRYQLGLGGLLACLDELAIAAGRPEGRRAEAAARDDRPRSCARGGAGAEAGQSAHAAAAGRAAQGARCSRGGRRGSWRDGRIAPQRSFGRRHRIAA